MICKSSDLGFRVLMIRIIKFKGSKAVEMEKNLKSTVKKFEKHIFFNNLFCWSLHFNVNS